MVWEADISGGLGQRQRVGVNAMLRFKKKLGEGKMMAVSPLCCRYFAVYSFLRRQSSNGDSRVSDGQVPQDETAPILRNK